MEAIKTMELTKRYGDTVAVDGLNLSIEQGEIFALLGENGAGKTTAVKMLSCITAPTGGDALVCGASILRDRIEVKRQIGVSPQETAVASNLTVRENLSLIAALHGLSRGEQAARIEELSARFGLASVLSRRAGKLSGGWQRRVSIAMAMIGQPRVLFLDEPTLGLDVLARSELWDILRGLKGRVTVVLTTHYMEEAEALSDHIGIMKNGRLLVVGTAEELMRRVGAERFEEAFISIVKEELR